MRRRFLTLLSLGILTFTLGMSTFILPPSLTEREAELFHESSTPVFTFFQRMALDSYDWMPEEGALWTEVFESTDSFQIVMDSNLEQKMHENNKEWIELRVLVTEIEGTNQEITGKLTYEGDGEIPNVTLKLDEVVLVTEYIPNLESWTFTFIPDPSGQYEQIKGRYFYVMVTEGSSGFEIIVVSSFVVLGLLVLWKKRKQIENYEAE